MANELFSVFIVDDEPPARAKALSLFEPVSALQGGERSRHNRSGTHVLRRTLESIESSLDPAIFIRINRSVIVNKAVIKAVEVVSHGDSDIELTTGQHLTWTRKYHRDVQLV